MSDNEIVIAAATQVERNGWSLVSAPIHWGPDPDLGGLSALWRFDNGFGASVINHRGSYGVELAVIRFTGPGTYDWVIDMTTPVTDDVIGWIESESALVALLRQIQDL